MSNPDRKRRLSTVAKAGADLLSSYWTCWLDEQGEPAHTILRQPEIGTVMVRGRAGATGAPFNLGEITVTRASVKLGCGTTGHGYVQGRDKSGSLIAALIDALGQTSHASAIDQSIIDPLEGTQEEAAKRRREKAAATKVDFFTLVRGHD